VLKYFRPNKCVRFGQISKKDFDEFELKMSTA